MYSHTARNEPPTLSVNHGAACLLGRAALRRDAGSPRIGRCLTRPAAVVLLGVMAAAFAGALAALMAAGFVWSTEVVLPQIADHVRPWEALGIASLGFGALAIAVGIGRLLSRRRGAGSLRVGRGLHAA